ncbi:response regulator [Paracoccus sp. (in: a-proteobacteria)]|uniref:response regulator transcription factor n=1 Tax=Paracoccus sp. TaxID=267 RepID=UPI00289FDC73|nr:response regulator [Paracoccus sp. (in: a-proteobacteria)]
MPDFPPSAALTVFVVDDDADIRMSLSRGLSKRGYQVETFASARAFLTGYDSTRAGCLVLDYGMPDMNGLELQSYLLHHQINIPIIFITGHGGVPESVQAIRAGAIDFLEKPFRQADLIACIDIAFQQVLERVSLEQHSQSQRARFDRLTARELEIVKHILARPSATSSKELASQFGISHRTVDHHRARILEKLGVKSVAELIALANS